MVYKIFEPYISQLIIQNPHVAEQLLRVGRAPIRIIRQRGEKPFWEF